MIKDTTADHDFSQEPEVIEREKWGARTEAFEEIISAKGAGSLGFGASWSSWSNNKSHDSLMYQNTNTEIKTGDIVSYEKSGSDVDGVVIDGAYRDLDGVQTPYAIKVRSFDGIDYWVNSSALTCLSSYEDGDENPGNNECGATDKYCPLVGGRCRIDCIMESGGFCMLTNALYGLFNIFLDGYDLEDFVHKIKRLW